MRISLSHCLRVVVVTWLGVGQSEAGKGGGKTASKVGLAAISQAGSSGGGHDHGALPVGDIHLDGPNGTLMQNNVMAKLKHDLLLLNGYDKSVRPVRNHSDSVHIEVDFTYMQVLHLDEKDQILKSKLRSRLTWTDQYLSWDPHDYDGILSIRLPATMIWMPDIACYEEIGVKDFTPRIPYVYISHEGEVRYFEPTSYETTCGVNIAYFPFDHQTCHMTFTSWVFPTSKLDIKSRRSREELLQDIPLYFVNTGEWILDDIRVEKISQSFVSLLASHEDEDEGEHEEHEDVEQIIEQQFFHMDPQKPVKMVAPDRSTDLHWSEIRFTYKLRRNSSLYMQSMLFPALLLTTISLLGFYLPPDSGERIGLQITIMLTFMVFLLTVGDMFPASTGPYLGVYFVLCMAMLGLNIVMTVLVLNLHHMPYAAVMRGPNDNGEYYIRMDAVPLWVRASLYLGGLYSELTEFKLTEEDIRGKLNKPKEQTSITRKVKPMLKKYKSFVRSKTLGTIRVEGLDSEKGCTNSGFATAKSLDQLQEDTKRSGKQQRSRVTYRRNFSSEKLEDLEERKEERKTSGIGFLQTICKAIGASSGDDCDTLLRDTCQDLLSARQDVAAATEYLRCQFDELKDDKRAEAMEEKWKDVARKLDVVCLRVYIFVLAVFHICILVAVFVGF